MRAAPGCEISTTSITKSRSLFFNLAALLFYDYPNFYSVGKLSALWSKCQQETILIGCCDLNRVLKQSSGSFASRTRAARRRSTEVGPARLRQRLKLFRLSFPAEASV